MTMSSRKELLDFIKSAIAELKRHDEELSELSDTFQEAMYSFVDETINLSVKCELAREYLEEAWEILGRKPANKGK
jgi:hypothetical protein